MVTREMLKKGIANPGKTLSYVSSKVSTKASQPRQSLMEATDFYYRRVRNMTGMDVMEADWDNLIVLDACRYDLFESVNTIDGDLSPVVSKAGWTPDFLERNFDGGEFPKTVYVSANPMLVHIDARFHDRIRLWEDSWSEEIDVVPPEAVVEAALEAAEKYPNKRLIVHFMQPHHPFIGETGRRLVDDGQITHYENGITFWNQLRGKDERTRELFWEAYQENLELTLPKVQRLVEDLPGMTVVTSDHGNEFGRLGIYGHMRGYTEALRTVPWLVTDYDERKEVTAGEATVGARDEAVRSSDIAKERLRKLGYVDG